MGGAVAANTRNPLSAGVVSFAGALLFAGAMLVMQRIVRCPKCQARLGRTIAIPLAVSWGSGPKIAFCPYCGVNLDQPLPRTQGSAQPFNPIQ